MAYSQKAVINNLRAEKKRLAGELLIADGKLEAIENYILELEGTGSFVDKKKIMHIIKGDEVLEENV